MDDDSDSSLSSTHSTDDEALIAKMNKPVGIQRFFKPTPKNEEKELSPEPPKRAPSPPHEYVLADNDAIAFVVMFRSRFSDAFPKSLPHYGPQDIERGVSGDVPQEDVERLLCALLGLVLNRKKDVEKGHYGRALEDAISQNQSQWPRTWNGQNPLHGGKSFNNMTPEERLILLKTLVLWALNSSESVQNLIKAAYKQTRRDDDKNQPKSVQPWFSDSYRRKFYLIEGLEDTHFRVYRENDAKLAKNNTWFSVAGSIEEATALADKLEGEGTSLGKVNAGRIRAAIPRFETGEEKRKRRDYRLARKAAFARPEPGFSLYEGRTRGKRMRYTYSDGEEEDSDSFSTRRSMRNSGYATPSEAGPTVTSSGRQVKSRVGGLYGESLPMDQRREIDREQEARTSVDDDEEVNNNLQTNGRRARAVVQGRGRYADGLQSESESDAGAESSGKEWSGNEDESDEEEPEPDFDENDDDDEMSDLANGNDDDGEEEDNTHESLVVQLRYRPGTKLADTSAAVSRKGTPLREVTNASAFEHKESDTTSKAHTDVNHKTNRNIVPSITEHDTKILANGFPSTRPIMVNGVGIAPTNGLTLANPLQNGNYPAIKTSASEHTKQETPTEPSRAMDLS